jgi:exportin-2 (importin alpha re-exporter)
MEFDYLEFVPYVLQILGFLIESHPSGSTTLPDAYRVLFQSILTPAFWDRSGNIPALSRLLQAYIEKAGESIVLEKIVRIKTNLSFSIVFINRQSFSEYFNVLFLNQKFMIMKDFLY